MRAVALALALAIAASPLDASACMPIRSFTDGGRYVGGDLPTQIAARAHTIQLVRVARLDLARWTTATEFVDAQPVFNIRFEVIETLAMRGGLLFWQPQPPPGSFVLEGQRRRLTQRTADGHWTIDEVQIWFPPEALDRPGSRDGVLDLRAPVPMSQATSCEGEIRVLPGELFIALRNETGALYSFSTFSPVDSTALRIDFNYGSSNQPPPRGRGGAPPLLRITGRDDPIYARIRAALIANERMR